jgi:membrane protein insertase Oxa1/YidC/SpoIIIJ
VAFIVTALTVGSLVLAPQPPGQHRNLMMLLPAIFTMIALSKMAAGVGLYWGVSSVVGLVQTLVIRRGRPIAAA